MIFFLIFNDGGISLSSFREETVTMLIIIEVFVKLSEYINDEWSVYSLHIENFIYLNNYLEHRP